MKLARTWGPLTVTLALATGAFPARGQAAATKASAGAAVAAASSDQQLALLRAAGLASRHAAEVVRSLTDEVGPRLAGSAGDRAAVAWALRTLREHGFGNVHAEAVRVPHWERGDEAASVVSPVPHKLAVTALGGSVGTKPGGLEADVVEFRSLEALAAAAPGSLSGKIAFMNVVTAREKDGSGYGKAGRVRWESGEEAKKRGAVAVVIRSIGTDHDRLPHTGSARQETEAGAIPLAAISNPDADLLHRLVERNGTARVRLSLGCKWLPDAESANVVAEVRGSERPDEIVLLGAHLDSWDLGTGALDDGAGVAIVTEALRLVGTYTKPRRTVRVVLYANEESGLAGGRAYAKAHEAELAKHVVALEADSGTGRVWATRYVGAPERRASFLDVAKLVAPLGVAVGERDAYGGADISPLRAAGVPLVDLQQDMSQYFDIHHTANDTYDKIDPTALAQAATSFALMAQGFASMEGDFGRIPEAKRERPGH